MNQSAFRLRGRNPDVLSCIANLSNDEVFTPPEFAKQMLDSLGTAWAETHDGASIWEDDSVRFLDPFTKTGVFLREIVARLTEGLSVKIPNLEERVNHILMHQVYGIGITHLTGQLSRRTVYCSKDATGKHSIASSFTNPNGNIWFERIEHSWTGTISGSRRCKYCGANEANFDRSADLETHAYAFIHSSDIRTRLSEMFGEDMQFDVIIGNPPFQLRDGGYGTSAAPIYQHFVEQAKKLEPRYLCLVIPARWYSGGKGLDEFRMSMLEDNRLRVIQDYPDSKEVFPGPQIKGGVCYFLWDRDSRGDVTVTTWDKGAAISTATRPLLEHGADVFIRYNPGVSILKKVISVETGAPLDSSQLELSLPEEKRFSNLVSARKPFGFDTTFRGKSSRAAGDLLLYRTSGTGYVARSAVASGLEVIDEWKVFIAYAGSGSDAFPHPILPKPFVGKPGSVSSETYLYIGPFDSESEASNVCTYLATRFVRFLALLRKPSQHATRPVYSFVPRQDFSKPWTDPELYSLYGSSEEEIAFIESLVRPMEIDIE